MSETPAVSTRTHGSVMKVLEDLGIPAKVAGSAAMKLIERGMVLDLERNTCSALCERDDLRAFMQRDRARIEMLEAQVAADNILRAELDAAEGGGE